MAAVDFIDVKKSFGAVDVIRGVTIPVEDGAFVSLVGPSGCGKSTLLRLLAGLEDISGGRIVINGRVVNKVRAKDRDIAMVFQNYALYPHMTVAENMGFALTLRSIGKADITRRVSEAADILGLAPLLDRLPGQLSGGQRQRVAMGRAIVRNPQVFLFDEPLSNLDAKLRVQMRAEIKSLHQRLGTTTVYVTHDQVEAMTMSSKIVVLRDGVVEQMGAPLELYDRPANAFVATFIGSPAMNLITGHLRRNGRGAEVILGDRQAITLPFTPPVADDAPVVLGVRPEHLTVATDGEVSATVDVVEPTGDATVISARCGESVVTITSNQRHAFAPGETIRLQPVSTALHLFDPDTGAALRGEPALA